MEGIQDMIRRLRSSVADRHPPKRLLAPAGPVLIEHIEGTDLLIIRGRRNGSRKGKRLWAPSGPVQIEHIEGSDLLLIRGRGKKRE